MLRTAVLIAKAVNHGVAMATTALVLHVATGGVLPAQATLGLVLAAGGVYALATAALLDRPALGPDHPAMALATRSSSISA